MTHKKVLIATSRSFNGARARKPLIKLLLDEGHEVIVVANSEVIYDKEITDTGAEFYEMPFYRHGVNVLKDTAVLYKIYKLIRQQKPVLVHAFNPKPIFIVGIVSYLVKIKLFCVSVTGLGALGSNSLYSKAIEIVYKLALRNADVVFVENTHDLNFLIHNKIVVAEKCRVQIASGVNVHEYENIRKETSNQSIIFSFASRLVWNKGIKELFEVAKMMKTQHGDRVRFLIAGDLEIDHPNGVQEDYIQQAVDSGYIEYVGRLSAKDIPQFLKNCDVVVLPSYREGFSKFLMEGAAAGKALITTEVPGCMEIVREGVNGLLVKPGNIDSLFNACNHFMYRNDLIAKYGHASQRIAIDEFDFKITAPRSIEQYEKAGLSLL